MAVEFQSANGDSAEHMPAHPGGRRAAESWVFNLGFG